MRKITLIAFLWAVAATGFAAQTNYFCVVCGKGPLTGQIWMHSRGVICDDCEKIKERCAICGLPVRDNDGHIRTPDGRFICRFDKPNVILAQDQAADLFEQTRNAVVDLYGRDFALKYPNVTVSLFDVDYWSEKQGESGLHKFGFSHTRKTSTGQCTHEVVMLSGRTRDEMTAVAAHEYTHLWINENRQDGRQIDGDTIEAICELTAYKLMAARKNAGQQKRILENPYTNGKIKTLVALDQSAGLDYILNWVKNGKEAAFDESGNPAPIPTPAPAPITYVPRQSPAGLKFTGIMTIGKERQAVINGTALSVGDVKTIKLRNQSVSIRCQAINDTNVVVLLGNLATPVTLTKGQEKALEQP